MSHLSIKKLQNLYFNSETRVSIFRGVRNDTLAPVAIKERAFESLESANQTIREAMTQMQLSHPSICQAYDCFLEIRDSVIVSVLVLELMEKDVGQEIRDRQQRGEPWSEEELLTHLASLVSALSYAQGKGISHRDIKLQNIFLTGTQLKLGDFGSSDFFLDVGRMSRSLQGTPFYMSPELRRIAAELFLGSQDLQYDPFKADVYSLGVTFLFMARLELPREFPQGKNLEAMTEQLVEQLHCYPRLRPLLLAMLELNPERRIVFSELECSLQAESKESMQAVQSLDILKIQKTLKPCLICSRPVFSMEWTAHISPDCCRFWDFFQDLCSLQCLMRMKAELEQKGISAACIWCLQPQKVVIRDAISLPCSHAFHEKLCFFSFLRCMSDNFNCKTDFRCPQCSEPISQEFIDTVLGKTTFEESVFVYQRERCEVCKQNTGERFCRNQHVFCGKCLTFYLYFIPMCPLCGSIRVSMLPKTDYEQEVNRLLSRH